MASQTLIAWLPLITPPAVIYFGFADGFMPGAGAAATTAANMALGTVIGEVLFCWFTNTKFDLWKIFKNAAFRAAGAFLGVMFVLPLTGMNATPVSELIAAVAGGYLMNWLLQMF